MALAKVTCTCATCGNKFEVRAHRNNSREAASFVEWAQENITECYDCKASRARAARDAENAVAAAEAAEKGLPNLTGSEKQIAWANTVRSGILNLVGNYYSTGNGRKLPAASACLEGITSILLSHTSAGWWIDNRSASTMRSVLVLLQNTDFDALQKLNASING